MKNYRVILREHPYDSFLLTFDCMADDAEHAIEQARDMYPDCVVIGANRRPVEIRHNA